MQLIVEIDQTSDKPLYRKISDSIRKLIVQGTLQPGQLLPSSRELAESMSVSRLTVRRSYEELVSQGYIKTSHRGKTFVRSGLAVEAAAKKKVDPEDHLTIHFSDYGQRILAMDEELPGLYLEADMSGAPTLDELPITRWRDCLQAAVRMVGTNLLIYESDSFGYRPLRDAIHGLLSRTRAVHCEPEQIVIYPSTEGMDLVCRLVTDEGDTVAVEDPGFAGARRSFETHALDVKGIPIDNFGLRVDALKALPETPALVYVTPSHHDPTGIPMSLGRRKELLDWASTNEALIVEDDFDCEFRYGEDPMPSLQSLDTSGCVYYRYNFWKSMYPLVRIGFGVLPPNMVPVMRKARQLLDRDYPVLEQAALAEFISGGHFERHLQSCQKIYTKRRAAMIHALTVAFGKSLTISRKTGGTHVLVQFDGTFSEPKILEAAEAVHLPLVSTKVNYHDLMPKTNEFIISFATINEQEISRKVEEFQSKLSK